MSDKYGSDLDLKIFTTDSAEALRYNFRSSTNVLFNDELVPLDIATNRDKLDIFLSKNI
jgi:hypothetical protein